MDGGTISIWLKELLTDEQKIFIKGYEDYLQTFKQGYSFIWKYQKPSIQKDNLLNRMNTLLGFTPKQELLISGLANPMFRSAEQLMKNLNGYYVHGSTKDISNEDGVITLLEKYLNDFDETQYKYIVDWRFFEGYFNRFDDEEIRAIYNINL